ncbi:MULTISPECIES: DUF4282 domain-containing protein [Alkalimonas]|uniref:DUF4282 domain-containing protein n=1 Tax=Alkalimonas amylolytica TaxID=152573 RepID=A0A1H4ATR5_ALKAM|nr:MULTISPECIES: DUF4282 domain-containing protein [Alkalimonas]MCC5824717.1 DUF4282 domain-containing protein [Alkalimonas sp.]SEA39256.1 protein of unknown function [Alkalimonas amylolytica]
MNQVLFFDSMLTPKIITFVYWLLLLGVALSGLGTMFTTSFFAGLGILIFGAIGVRIWCELLIVLFKIHENLRKLADKDQPL